MASGRQPGTRSIQERMKLVTRKADLASQITAMMSEQGISDEEAIQMLGAISIDTLTKIFHLPRPLLM